MEQCYPISTFLILLLNLCVIWIICMHIKMGQNKTKRRQYKKPNKSIHILLQECIWISLIITLPSEQNVLCQSINYLPTFINTCSQRIQLMDFVLRCNVPFVMIYYHKNSKLKTRLGRRKIIPEECNDNWLLYCSKQITLLLSIIS